MPQDKIWQKPYSFPPDNVFLMQKYVILTLLLTLLPMLVFYVFPQLDLAVAAAFYTPENGFVGLTAWGRFGRQVGNVTPFLVLAAMIIAYGLKRFGWNVPLAPSFKTVAFVTLTMIAGPLLVVNLGMKDHLHRPRPVQVTQFGGKWEFKPFYRFDGECPKNCAFPSGEASEAFWMVAPAMVAPPQWRAPAVVGALIFGAATSALRMAFGGHFFSDVIIAGLITLLLIFGIYRWIFGAQAREP